MLNLLGLIVFASIHFSAPSQIVYVDAIKILAGYKGMEEAKKEFDTKVSQWNANLDTLKLEMETKLAEYETKHQNLSLKEKRLTEDLLEAKRAQYQNYESLIAEKISKEDKELTAKVYSKVNDYPRIVIRN
jgi:outer membrane protein